MVTMAIKSDSDTNSGSSKTLGMDYLFFLRKTNEEEHCLWRETDVQIATTVLLTVA